MSLLLPLNSSLPIRISLSGDEGAEVSEGDLDLRKVSLLRRRFELPVGEVDLRYS